MKYFENLYLLRRSRLGIAPYAAATLIAIAVPGAQAQSGTGGAAAGLGVAAGSAQAVSTSTGTSPGIGTVPVGHRASVGAIGGATGTGSNDSAAKAAASVESVSNQAQGSPSTQTSQNQQVGRDSGNNYGTRLNPLNSLVAHPPRTRYDIATAVADSLGSSTEVQLDMRNIEIDSRRVDEAAAAGRPQLSTSASATRYDQATKVSFGPQAVTVLGTHSEVLSINLSNRFDIAGQIRAAKTQASLQQLSDRFVLQAARNRRILQTKQSYFTLLRAGHQRDVANSAVAAATQQQSIASKLYQNQVGQKIDLLRANAQLASARQQSNDANSQYIIARNAFNNNVGNPLATAVTLDDSNAGTFDYLSTPVNGVIGSGSGTTTASNSISVSAPPSLKTLEEYIALGKANRPDIAIDQLNIRIAETGITLARSALAPSFSIGGSGDYFPTTSFQTPRQRTAAITATLVLPLYDGGATRDRVAEARLRKENAQDISSSRLSDVEVQVSEAYSNTVNAAQQIEASNIGLQEALAARQLAQVRYENQVGLYLEVSNAEAALEQAEANNLNALYNYRISKAQLEDVSGIPSATE